MRRWLTILLMLFMPLQFSLAAVSAYCGPESGQTAAHGEQHHHEGDAAHGDPAAGGTAGHIDIDFAHCHSGGATAILGSVHLAAVNASSGAARIAYEMRALSPPPLSPPERPKWAALA